MYIVTFFMPKSLSFKFVNYEVKNSRYKLGNQTKSDKINKIDNLTYVIGC